MSDPNLTPGEQASEVAIHKAKNAQAAVELARELQLEEAIEKTAARTKEALIEGLTEVFGEGDQRKDPAKMQILIRRIPLICKDVRQIHVDMKEMKDDNKEANDQIKADVAKINDNIARGVWIILGAVLLAIINLVLKS